MATRSKFQALAAKMIGNKFADFAGDCILSNAGVWNPTTQSQTPEKQTIKAIRTTFTEGQFNGQSILVGDYRLVAEYQKITIPVSVDTTSCTFNGEVYRIVSVVIDPAEATITMQIRRK